MNRKGPLFTLLGGLALAGILLGASISAANDDEARRNAAANGDNGAAVGAAPTTNPNNANPNNADPTGQGGTAPTTKAAAALPKTTFAGKVADAGKAVLAITVNNGKAIAYLCNGSDLEAWYQGTAKDGKLTLTGGDGARITGEYGGGKAVGRVTANGTTWSFTAPAVAPPSGLYRAVADVANARVVGGWIELEDGSQTGLLRRNGVAEPAPPLSNGSVVVGGATLTASPVDPEAGLR